MEGKTIEILLSKHRNTPVTLGWEMASSMIPTAQAVKKNWKSQTQSKLRLPRFKEHYREHEKTAHRIGKHLPVVSDTRLVSRLDKELIQLNK